MAEGNLNQETTKLSPDEEKMKRLFGLSFMHSQGIRADDNFQTYILDWILDYVPKSIDIELKMPEYGLPTIPTIHRKESSTPEENRIVATPPAVQNWVNLYNLSKDLKETGRHRYKREDLITRITHDVVLHDFHFMTRGRLGRKAKKGWTPEPDSRQDPYASFFRKYVILKSPTGEEAYDDMYKEVAKMHDKLMANDAGYKSEFDLMVKKWEERHTGVHFLPSKKKDEEAS